MECLGLKSMPDEKFICTECKNGECVPVSDTWRGLSCLEEPCSVQSKLRWQVSRFGECVWVILLPF